MNVVAREIGLDPGDFRRRNFIQEGQTSAVGQLMKEPIEMDRLLDRALELSDYHAKRRRFAASNPGAAVKRGIGFATFMHGAGFTGSGEDYLASVVDIEATAAGRIRVLAASAEIGQGTNTIFGQIAADALGVDFDDVEIAQPDTAAVPNSGPTVASRTCMVVGLLVENAARRWSTLVSWACWRSHTPATPQYAASAWRHADRFDLEQRSAARMRWDDSISGDATRVRGRSTWRKSAWTTTFGPRRGFRRASGSENIHPCCGGQIEGGARARRLRYENVVWREGGCQRPDDQLLHADLGRPAEHPGVF